MDDRGRPTVHTQEIADHICQKLAEGMSLRAICRLGAEENDTFPSEAAVRQWVIDDREGFAAQYTRSREIGLDCRADALIEDAKLAKDAALGRLAFDADRWYLSKLAPKRYGDKQTTVLEDANGNNPFMALMEAVSSNGRPRPSS
jgi:hypothetical protein